MRAALYARYSTDLQREESIADQHRVCERLAERHGFRVVAKYADQAISGGTTQRPDYQRLLRDARARKFDVIVAEDTSRLWRNLAEQAPRLAELSDLGVAVVTHDLDSRSESAGILGAVTGAMSESYRREIARRTRRGLEGLARAEKPTGGRSYGYLSAAESGTGDREVQPEQANVVRRIFEDYAAGVSAQAICAALNREGIPSPGSSWNRNERRRRGWVVSAIAGDPTRGVGILNNELYLGRVIWNRFRWVRSASDSSKRRCIQNPRADWIVREDERLRIIPQALWDRVKARQAERKHRVGERIARGISASKASRTGPRPRHLFSGLLDCKHCGASIVATGRNSMACSSFVHGRDCTNDARVPRELMEEGLLAGMRDRLLNRDALEVMRRRLVAALSKRQDPGPSPAKRIAELEREAGNLADAIAQGALRASPTIAARLAAVEAELDRLRQPAAETPAAVVAALTPGLTDRIVRLVSALPTTIRAVSTDRGRAEISDLIGRLDVVADAREVRFLTKKGALERAFVRLAGGQHTSVVAGA
ncbi:MAG: recombinase family protein, partial [Burkholderiales bacterium]|nr:recombinase family protein [Burkholderiales bacterium]